MDGSAAETGIQHEFLVRAPRLRIRGLGTVLANLPVRWAVRVAVSDGPLIVAGPEKSRREPSLASFVPGRFDGDCVVLWRGLDVASTNQPGHSGVLALVGGAFVGGRLL